MDISLVARRARNGGMVGVCVPDVGEFAWLSKGNPTTCGTCFGSGRSTDNFDNGSVDFNGSAGAVNDSTGGSTGSSFGRSSIPELDEPEMIVACIGSIVLTLVAALSVMTTSELPSDP